MTTLKKISDKSHPVFIPSVVAANSLGSTLNPVAAISNPQLICDQADTGKTIAFNVNFSEFSEDSLIGKQLPGATGEYRIDLAAGTALTTLNFSNAEPIKISRDFSREINPVETHPQALLPKFIELGKTQKPK